MRFHSNIGQPKDGWMRFRFTGEGGEIDIVASYVPNDPFYEFVTAIQAVHEHGTAHEVRLNEEPQTSILTLEKCDEKLVLSLRGADGTLRGRVEAGFQSACREIARSLYHLEKDVGYDRFVREWRHAPPRARIREFWTNFGATG
jgi:hypothetical protein